MRHLPGAIALALSICALSTTALAQQAGGPLDDPEATIAQALDGHWLSTDSTANEQLRVLIGQIEGADKAEYVVQAGLVTLRGEVASAATRELVGELAGKVPGVLGVQNLLTVARAAEANTATPDVSTDDAIQARVSNVLSEAAAVKGLRVRVNSGVVTLSGEVGSTERAEELAALTGKLGGVVHVINDISVPLEVTARVQPAVRQLRELATKTVAFLPILGIALILFMLTLSFSRLVRRMNWPYRRLTDRPLMRELARQAAGTLVFIVGLLIIFEILDVTAFVGALLGTAGLAGLAIGFAFQDIVENYLSSIMLSVQQPFQKGDGVTIGDHSGKVIRMTMRDTVLMTYDGNHVRIPNAQVFKSSLTNFSRNPRRRFDFKVGVGNEENLMDVQSVALDILKSVDGVLADPGPAMVIEELGDSSVLCGFYAWIDQRDTSLRDARSEAIRRVKLRFEREGFDMPEPIYRLNLNQLEPIARPARTSEPIEDGALTTEGGEDAALDLQLADEADDERDLL